jgi:hypothetical protein
MPGLHNSTQYRTEYRSTGLCSSTPASMPEQAVSWQCRLDGMSAVISCYTMVLACAK